MAQYNIQLRGWQAIVALVVMAGITGVQMYSRLRPVDDAMRAAVRMELLKDYSGRGSRDLARLVREARQAGQGPPAESLSLPPLVQADVELIKVDRGAGSLGGTIAIRAEVTVDGGPPPDGRPVRYFWVSRKFGGNGTWQVLAETDSYRYFMALWPSSRDNHSF